LENVIKCRKYSLPKFANFVYICIAIFACNTKVYKLNLQILQGYIFRIFQHFATKLCHNLLILVCSFQFWWFICTKAGFWGEVWIGGTPLRSFCASPENFCTSPERSCTSPWDSFNDGTKWTCDVYLGSTLRDVRKFSL
jgi:hypothetical protein